MKISARHVLAGKIVSIIRGPGTPEMTLELPGGAQIASPITSTSAQSLELMEGSNALAIIKSSSVMIGVTE